MQKSDKLMLQEMNMPLRPVGDKLRAISSKTPPSGVPFWLRAATCVKSFRAAKLTQSFQRVASRVK